MTSLVRRSLSLLLALSLGIIGCRSAERPLRTDAAVTAFSPELNALSFDQLHERIRDAYYAPARLNGGPGGVDWDGLHRDLRPRIEAAAEMEEVRALMHQVLEALGESHFAIIPGQVYQDLLQRDFVDADANAVGSVGIRVRTLNGVPIVGFVDAGSSGASKVRAGWTVEAVNGEDILAGASQLRITYGQHPLTDVRVNEWLESKLTPAVGQSVVVRFRDTRGTSHTLRLISRQQPGMWASFGVLPAMNLRYGSKTLRDRIGYFSLSVFLDPPQVMPAYGEFIRQNQTARGIILDLRGNPGGIGAMATGMSGFLIGEEGKRIGTMIRRDGNLPFVINPRYPQFVGPVAILVDQMSLSTSEILAGGLQDLGRARVFGQPTPGAALPSTILRLANGDVLQYALADYVSASGRRLEGRGITPDVVIPLDRSALESGQDQVLDAACRWIEETAEPTTKTAQLHPR